MHYDAAPDDSGLTWLCDPQSKVSAHFHISRMGSVSQLVELEHAAWHAGLAEMPDLLGQMQRRVNLWTVGIELGNIGPLWRGNSGRYWYESGGESREWKGAEPVDLGDQYWEPYSIAQLDALVLLLHDLRGILGDAVSNVCGHDEIAVPRGRKPDPGPAFPWQLIVRKHPWVPA